MILEKGASVVSRINSSFFAQRETLLLTQLETRHENTEILRCAVILKHKKTPICTYAFFLAVKFVLRVRKPVGVSKWNQSMVTLVRYFIGSYLVR